MKDNHDHVESYNRSILFLSLFVAVIYPMVTYIPDIRSRGEIPTISNPIYVEIAREDEPPYIVRLDDNHEAREFGETYRLQSPPKNGDKLIIDAMDRITLSRIDARKCLAL